MRHDVPRKEERKVEEICSLSFADSAIIMCSVVNCGTLVQAVGSEK